MTTNGEVTASTLAAILEWVLKNNTHIKGRSIIEAILEQYDQQLLKNHDT